MTAPELLERVEREQPLRVGNGRRKELDDEQRKLAKHICSFIDRTGYLGTREKISVDDNRDTFFTDRPAGEGRNAHAGPWFFVVDARMSKLMRLPGNRRVDGAR